MKVFLKKVLGLFWCKTALAYLLGGISSVVGLHLTDTTIESIVCLLGVAGCN